MREKKSTESPAKAATPKGMAKILQDLPVYREKSEALREIFLANLVMLGEIPAPTFGEQDRQAFLQQRFSESELSDVGCDEVDNCMGLIPGTEGDRPIVVVAHSDTVFSDEVDHTVTIRPDRVLGAGIGDSALGLATLATLPTLADHLGIRFRHPILLLGASRSLGRGNLEGLRYFLENNTLPIQAGVCLKGIPLGRLSIQSTGMLRGDITCRVPEDYDWWRFGATSAIVTLNEVIDRIVEMPLPRRPRTTVVFESIRGGTSFNTLATNAELHFEIRSESAGMVREIRERIEDIVAEVTSQSGGEVVLDVYAGRQPGGIPSGHPMARRMRAILDGLEIKPLISPSTSELCALIDHEIPAVTLGLSKGQQLEETRESVLIEPVFAGMAQLMGALLAIDGGFCEENRRVAET